MLDQVLAAELASIRPQVLVALGATAAKALFGDRFRVTEQHGVLQQWPPRTGPNAGNAVPLTVALATIHPSAVLRARTKQDRQAAFDNLVADLSVVAGLLGPGRASRREGSTRRGGT